MNVVDLNRGELVVDTRDDRAFDHGSRPVVLAEAGERGRAKAVRRLDARRLLHADPRRLEKGEEPAFIRQLPHPRKVSLAGDLPNQLGLTSDLEQVRDRAASALGIDEHGRETITERVVLRVAARPSITS